MQTNAASTSTRRDGQSGSNPLTDAWKTVVPETSRVAERDGDRYELLGELATGGMATVYLGRMRRPMGFNRLVAIKCMHPQYARDPSFASMFLDEARLTARLRHPNIVPTLDIVGGGGRLLIVMEYVEGESLARLFTLVRDAGAAIPVAVACAIIHDLLLGLHEAHESTDDDGSALAIIHRDVSPQNVMVGLDGLARILDFGVAKARRRVHQSNEGEIKGKLPYMAPEQLFGEGVDRRVDIYGAGVLLWESLVGERLFEGSSEELLVRRIDAGDVPLPGTRATGISPELDALVMRALCKDAGGRFPTALAMAEAISGLVALPPRTEISAWMRRFATPRAVPASAIDSSLDLTEPAGVSPDAFVAVLEQRATKASRPTSRLTMGVGIATFALAGVLVGRTMHADVAHAETSHHAAVAAPVVTANEPVIAIAPSPSPIVRSQVVERVAPPVAPAASALSPAGRAVAAKPVVAVAVAAKPAAAAAEPAAPAPAPLATSDAKPASCRLPYAVDAEGHRHYKVECL